MTIEFYGKFNAFGEFSNFADYPITVDGVEWPKSEHYFQAMKFHDADYRRAICSDPNPMTAKKLGQTRKVPLRPDWDNVKDDIMLVAVREKFRAYPDLAALLLSTGDEDIIEAAPTDYYWGAGRTGSGKNMLGKILMRVRDELRTEAGQKAD